jgi:hypothetical protein
VAVDGATDEACVVGRQSIGRVAVDPNNSQIVYAATSTNGIARSDNGGASWTLSFPCEGATCSGAITDVVIDSTTSPSTVYAALGDIFGNPGNGVFRATTDLPHAAASWTRLGGSGGGAFPTSDVGRIRLATTTTSPPTLYAVVNRVSTSGLLGLWKSTDRGATWAQTTHLDSVGTSSQNTWYNLEVATFPSDPSVAYVLALEVLKSTNGGTSWTNVSQSQAPPFKVHVDQHTFGFVPGNASAFYLGNDGGMYKSTDGGTSFASLNATLATVQFFRGAAHPTDTSSAFGGTQDNGSLSYQGTPN